VLRKLTHLDVAYNYTRHITSVGCDDFVQKVNELLTAPGSFDRPRAEDSTNAAAPCASASSGTSSTAPLAHGSDVHAGLQASTLSADAAIFVPGPTGVHMPDAKRSKLADSCTASADVADARVDPLPAKPPLSSLDRTIVEETVQNVAKFVRGEAHKLALDKLPRARAEFGSELIDQEYVADIAKEVIKVTWLNQIGEHFCDAEKDERVEAIIAQSACDVARFWLQDLAEQRVDGRHGTTGVRPVVASSGGPPGGLRQRPGFGHGPCRTKKGQ